jgi:hypothetical protein
MKQPVLSRENRSLFNYIKSLFPPPRGVITYADSSCTANSLRSCRLHHETAHHLALNLSPLDRAEQRSKDEVCEDAAMSAINMHKDLVWCM